MRRFERSGLLLVGGLATAASLFLALVFVPGMKRLRTIRENLDQKRAVVRRDAELQRTIDALQDELRSTAAYVQRWRGRTTRRDELGLLYGKISDLATAAGVTTTRFEPETAVALETLERVPLTLSVQGPSGGSQRLIASLEQLPKLIWVDEAKLLATSDGGETVQCELKLSIFVDRTKISD